MLTIEFSLETLAGIHFGSVAMVDISRGAGPTHDISAFVEHGQSSHDVPSIRALRIAERLEADFRFVLFTAREGVLQCVYEMFEVFGRHHLCPTFARRRDVEGESRQVVPAFIGPVNRPVRRMGVDDMRNLICDLAKARRFFLANAP